MLRTTSRRLVWVCAGLFCAAFWAVVLLTIHFWSQP